MNFTDRLSQRIRDRTAEEEETVNNGEAEFIETFVASPFYGVENVRNSPACIDLRLNNYTFKAIPYIFIVEISYNPSEGIEILTSSKKVLVTGRNLKLLYSFLTAYRIRFIEANIGNDTTDEKSLFVKDIKIEDL